MPFSVMDIVNDPDLAEPFIVIRDEGGAWNLGNWVPNTTTLNYFGVVQPATNKELDMVPEGDRSSGAFMFHSSSPLYETRVNAGPQSNTGLSDVLVWRGIKYRILAVQQWQDFGYWQALAVRMMGA